MTDHTRARELAMVALDFELDPAERAELNGHLEGCHACTAYASSARRDAAALAGLPRVDAPGSVREQVQANRADRGGPVRGLAPAVALVVLLVVPLGLAAFYRGGLGIGGGGNSPGGGGPYVTPHAIPGSTGAPTQPPEPTPSPSLSPSPGA